MIFEHGISSLHIIDSTTESDGEPGKLLAERLSLNSAAFSNMPVHLHQVLDRAEFNEVLDRIFSDEASRGFVPILHFEGHGDEKGFYLREVRRADSFISWDDLSLELARFNVATRFNLLVVLACCQGFLQIHSISYFRPCPFAGLVACTGSPTTLQLLEAYERLYRGIANKTPILNVVEEMNRGAGPASKVQFGLETAARMFRGVVEAIYRDNLNPEYLSEKKEQIRQKMAKDAAKAGNPSPISRKQVEVAFQESLEKTVRKFHNDYFAIEKIPENARVYGFEVMVTRVRRLVEEGH